MLRHGVRLWLVVVILGVSLAGCSKSRFVSVRFQPGESLEFFVPLCCDEQLRNLRLEAVDTEDPGQGQLLWSAQATGAEASTGRIEFGPQEAAEAPVSLADLSEDYLDHELLVSAATDRGTLVTSFTLAELPTDGSALKKGGGTDKVMSVADLQKAQRDSCSGSSAEKIALLAARIGVGGAVLGGAVWFVLRRRSQRREPALS